MIVLRTLPRKIGFRYVDEDPDSPLDMPKTDHVWEDEEWPFGNSHGGHRYDARCAICMFYARTEARDAVLAAVAPSSLTSGRWPAARIGKSS